MSEGLAGDRVLTIPNLLSAGRLVGVPVYLWLLLRPGHDRTTDAVALAIIVASGCSDYLDGKIARWLDQTSRLGIVLDPAADRLYVFATLVGFAIRTIIPWWLVGLLVGRDVVLGALIPLLRTRGYGPLQVHYLGKAATFSLMYGFPLLLLAAVLSGGPGDVVRPIAWAFTSWGTALYLWSGVLYFWQVVGILRREPRRAAGRARRT